MGVKNLINGITVNLYGTVKATPGNSKHGWGLALDIHSEKIATVVANQNAMQWLIDHIEDYGWSGESGVTNNPAANDKYHLIYFGLGQVKKLSVDLKPVKIITSKNVTPKTTTQKFKPLQPFTITPKVIPTGPGNSIHLVKTIDTIIAPPVAYNIGQTGPGGGRIFITPSALSDKFSKLSKL